MGIVFATPTELITRALKDIGVVGFGRSATAAEILDGLQVMNVLLDMWSVMRENITMRTKETIVGGLVIGQYIYTVGDGLDIDTVKPIRIEDMYYTDENNTDIHIDPMTEFQYNSIPTKGIAGDPTRYFYKGGGPTGTLYFNYAVQVARDLNIDSWKPYSKITDPDSTTELAYPDGMESAILFNLEELLCGPNKKVVTQTLHSNAMMSLQAVQAAYGETPVVVNWDAPKSDGRRGDFFSMDVGR